MKARYSAICSTLLILTAIKLAAQIDYTCTTYETEEISCNEPPYTACKSSATLPGVIYGGGTAFGLYAPRDLNSDLPKQLLLQCQLIPACADIQPLLRADLHRLRLHRG
jgi:hypothetical protein